MESPDSIHGETVDAGALYIVATPIGNLGDIGNRALSTLGSVDFVLCEDTRRTRTLLNHYEISAHCISFHEHNERNKTEGVIERLNQGQSAALVSDAGTPLISDPGYRLVNACVTNGIAVVPIPGASSVLALLSVSGLPTDRFVFEGFLPPKGAKRARRITEFISEKRTIVLFESPHRIARLLAELHTACGDRRCCLGRELTKKFEEIRHGGLADLSAWAEDRKFKGEITLVVAGAE